MIEFVKPLKENCHSLNEATPSMKQFFQLHAHAKLNFTFSKILKESDETSFPTGTRRSRFQYFQMAAIPWGSRQSGPQLYSQSPPHPLRPRDSVSTALYVGIGPPANIMGLRVATDVKGSSDGACAKITCTRVDFNGAVQLIKTNGTSVDTVG